MVIYSEGKDNEDVEDEERAPLPVLNKEQVLDLLKLDPKQHFTEPPPRYTEATIVKALEEKGIGRPSTYASIISTIQEREYVILEQKRFRPTELGMVVNDLLVRHFPAILDVGFTAGMENRLDDIEEGKDDKQNLLSEFYAPFEKSVNEANDTMEKVKPDAVLTDIMCPNCGKPMALRVSRLGKFLGCSGYPKCKTILNEDGSPREVPEKPEPVVSDQLCPKCGKPLVERTGRYGKFLGCSGYPKCKTIVKLPGDDSKPEAVNATVIPGVKCPKDGGDIVEKRSRRGTIFYGCSNYPRCDFATSLKPTDRACPECGYPLGEVMKNGRPTGGKKCINPDCSYTEKHDE
jgi:DNA topoisomerase-1